MKTKDNEMTAASLAPSPRKRVGPVCACCKARVYVGALACMLRCPFMIGRNMSGKWRLMGPGWHHTEEPRTRLVVPGLILSLLPGTSKALSQLPRCCFPHVQALGPTFLLCSQ